MRYISSGHSHGKQITVIFEGVPSNLEVNINELNLALTSRQQGYGRGRRMKIEHDQVEIVGGVIFGKTTGAPLTLIIQNKDYANHERVMDPFLFDESKHQEIKVPRPGHADLVGAMKYHVRDMKIIFERASARETVSRVVVGAICQQILSQLDISVTSFVRNIGGVKVTDEKIDMGYMSEVGMPNKQKSQEAMKKIDQAKQNKDTLGGIVQVMASNIPAGLGSFVSSDAKLDGKIASSLISIQACKGVEFGDGFDLANQFGSEVHDEIIYQDGFSRTSNHYGGFEGGMTTGMPLIIKAVFKPIPTLMQPLNSVNIDTKQTVPSHIERSDVAVLLAASVICEHSVSYEITKALCESFTSHSMEELIASVTDYRAYLKRY